MPAVAPALSEWARRLWGNRYLLFYLALAAWLLAGLRQAYHPPTGFSSLIWFGGTFAERRLPRLDDVPLYTQPGRDGYDGQFYAQIAVAGSPLDRGLETALDAPGYRARRVLLPVVAHILGLGRPGWVVQIYALANVFCWLLLAWLLARWWFPPDGFHNLLRWAGTLFGAGVMVSVTRSLTDLPALLVIAVAARCLERNRNTVAAALLAISGLVRETSILAVAALVPGTGGLRRRARAFGVAMLCLAPLAIWIGVLLLRYGQVSGERNFALPLVALAEKVRALVAAWRVHGFTVGIRGELWAVIALVTQAGFLFARPKPADPWWRLGAPFALLLMLLGDAVWEGEPSAAARVVLPLTLAFNVLAPRSGRGLALLVAGNLTLLSAASLLRVPQLEQTVFGRGITCSYQAGWHGRERLGEHTWRWASGASPAVIRLHNPTGAPVSVTLAFQLESVVDRQVTVRAPGRSEDVTLQGTRRFAMRVGPFALASGDGDVTFDSAAPAWVEPAAGGRGLTFSVQDLRASVAAPVR